jgi:hypothetical protein
MERGRLLHLERGMPSQPERGRPSHLEGEEGVARRHLLTALNPADPYHFIHIESRNLFVSIFQTRPPLW